jgi:protein-tyrosine phosphatase
MSPTTLLDDERRVLRFDGAHNFRDLGGYRTGDGRPIAWGRLFRADGLHRLSVADLERIRELGVRTVIDLRSEGEIDERGGFPVGIDGVAVHHQPVLDATWSDSPRPSFADADDVATAFLVWAYRQMIDEAGPRFAAAVELLARPPALPAVFHCAAGKDRTGLLAGLVLAVLGVDDAVIAADYQLTEPAMARKRAWAELHAPELAARYATTPPEMLAARPEAMLQILDDLRLRYGGAAGYLATHGVASGTIEHLTAGLVEP